MTSAVEAGALGPATAHVAPGAAKKARPLVNKWVVALSVAFGSLMATIDSSIVNVAVPHIRGSVGATLQEITWISTAYIVATVMVMPLTGFLGSFFGQKRVYWASLLLFVIGSALCGLARSLPALVAFRALQGLGAGALQPTQQAILRQTFPPEEQGMAMAMFAVVIMAGPALGPTLGGFITDNYNWPWIFYVNIPIGALGLFMVWRFVHEPDDVIELNRQRAKVQRANMDWLGIVFMVVAVCSLQFLIEEGPGEDWFDSPAIVVCAIVTGVAWAAFVIQELTAKAPVVNLWLLRDRTFLSGTAIGGIMFAMLMGSMFLLPVFMQELLGYDATKAGLALMPRTLIMMLCMPLIGKLYGRVPPALLVGVGVIFFVLGSFGFGRITLFSQSNDILIPMLITGLGFSFLFIPLTTAALSNIKRHELADAAGLNSFARQIGGSIGLTVFATLLGRFAAEAKATTSWSVSMLRPEASSRFAATVKQLMTQGFDMNVATGIAQRMYGGKAALEGFVLAFEKSFVLQGIAFLFVLPLLYFFRVNRSKPAVKVDHASME